MQTKIRVIITCFILCFIATGCQTRNTILTSREQYYLIPAGSKIQAVIVKDQPAQEVIVDQDMWAIDGGYLVELQESANRKVLTPEVKGGCSRK